MVDGQETSEIKTNMDPLIGPQIGPQMGPDMPLNIQEEDSSLEEDETNPGQNIFFYFKDYCAFNVFPVL